ncbi:hypothetical protein DFJ73DRAFT_959375 [Zopfochytrium polystomum]|nr:hypothetical protein DFJ73DRAFT_959375 [Zopfochytrium polystomum]
MQARETNTAIRHKFWWITNDTVPGSESTVCHGGGGANGMGEGSGGEAGCKVHETDPAAIGERGGFWIEASDARGWWREIDDLSHAAFLRLRPKYGNNKKDGLEKLVRACVASIPRVCADAAAAHATWYDRFSELLAKKKEAAAAAVTFEGELDAQQQQHATEQKDREKEKERRRAIREEIERWKESRNSNNNNGDDDNDPQQQQQAKAAKAASLRRAAAVRAQVAAYALRRAEREAAERAVEQAAEHARQRAAAVGAEEEGRRVRERNDDLVARRRRALLRKIEDAVKREKRIERAARAAAVHVPRDPARVYRPTAGYVARLLDVSSGGDHEEGARRAFRVDCLPKRLVPSWRREP